MRGVLVFQIVFWVFGSPGGPRSQLFPSVGLHPHTWPKYGRDTFPSFVHFLLFLISSLSICFSFFSLLLPFDKFILFSLLFSPSRLELLPLLPLFLFCFLPILASFLPPRPLFSLFVDPHCSSSPPLLMFFLGLYTPLFFSLPLSLSSSPLDLSALSKQEWNNEIMGGEFFFLCTLNRQREKMWLYWLWSHFLIFSLWATILRGCHSTYNCYG